MGTASITLTDARSAELQFPTAKPARTLGRPFPRGVALRVKPILVYDVPTRKDRASWRDYGGISTVEAAQGEAVRIEKELHELRDKADFPIELQAPELLDS
jgi:hypothetical protein